MLMVTKRMLIDASHSEETRVLVVNGNRLEDFDVEVESRKRLKGNVYLAKVIRVEPSLQAAFVDYGGNRHGFLAFGEIHPDYYQIPVADREALIAEDRAEAAKTSEIEETSVDEESPIETLGGDDSEEVEARRPVANQRKHYKIQEVIKRRQILLIQVVKEERGTKGAALSTYLSLAGRYCVLMPNTGRGGGISRKIGSLSDRKNLKKIVTDLGIPEGMAVIVRTAGAERSRAEIRRDYDYLLRLWNQIRELTLNSIAPSLVHEEGDLIKRSIRDLYTKDIDEVIIHGDDGYRSAKDFMKILIPSHAKKVQKYKEIELPLTHNYGIDTQLDAIHSSDVHLKSGGYIIINPTEALVAIDVNSGRATKERNIEETALKTNLEAAKEIARQLKLRDLAGLIVIDFIDMEVNRNQTKVERAMKEAMRLDRARIQIGRISPFGLLELSRQRLRPSLIETSSEPCPHCKGSGIRRSTETAAIEAMRAIEEEGMRKRSDEITVFVPTQVALYLLNRKRDALTEFEQRFEFKILLENDDSLIPPDLRIESAGEILSEDKQEKEASHSTKPDDVDDSGTWKRKRRRPRRKKVEAQDAPNVSGVLEKEKAGGIETNNAKTHAEDNDSKGLDPGSGKRRRRGRRGGRNRRKKIEENTVETATAMEDKSPETEAIVVANDVGGLKEPFSPDDSMALFSHDISSPKAEQTTNSQPKARSRSIEVNKPSSENKSEKIIDTKPKRSRKTIRSVVPIVSTETGQNYKSIAVKDESKSKRRSKRTLKEEKPVTATEAEMKEISNAQATSPADVREPRKPKTLSEQPPKTDETNAIAKASKTTVIDVGNDSRPSRSGWWDRN